MKNLAITILLLQSLCLPVVANDTNIEMLSNDAHIINKTGKPLTCFYHDKEDQKHVIDNDNRLTISSEEKTSYVSVRSQSFIDRFLIVQSIDVEGYQLFKLSNTKSLLLLKVRKGDVLYMAIFFNATVRKLRNLCWEEGSK